MNHIILARGHATCKVFDAANGAELFNCEARNDTTGTQLYGFDYYGHFGGCPLGDYELGPADDNHGPDRCDELDSEGPYFIELNDVNGLWIANDRGDIGIHGGGSGLQHPLADRQGWVVTHGCWRLQNMDLLTFVGLTHSGDRVTVLA